MKNLFYHKCRKDRDNIRDKVNDVLYDTYHLIYINPNIDTTVNLILISKADIRNEASWNLDRGLANIITNPNLLNEQVYYNSEVHR
jgi:hypothetical protein